MSRRDYLPEADGPFVTWCRNFVDAVAADPARYGLDAADAAALESALAEFADALATALEPGTRTVVTVRAKNEARAALEAAVRSAAHRVQSFPGTGAADRVDLGLAERHPRGSRIGPPDTRPMLSLGTFRGGSLPALRIADESNPFRTAFPAGVASAVVFTCARPAGTEPPAELDEWRFEGLATKAVFPLPERPGDAGRRVYAVAVWVNPRGQLGPRSIPLVVSPGLTLPAAA